MVFCQNRNVEVIKENLLKGLGYESNGNNLFNIDKLISKFKSGVSEKKLLETDLIIKNRKKKSNPLFPNVDVFTF